MSTWRGADFTESVPKHDSGYALIEYNIFKHAK